MKKTVGLVFIICSLHVAGFSQTSATDKQALVDEQIKTELVSTLKLKTEAAEKIIEIENEFQKTIAAASVLAENSEAEKKEKHKKIHSAHVLRRAKLMETPLTGRQMEDVIEVVETIRRKHKLQ